MSCTVRKARKNYNCFMCGVEIKKGEKYYKNRIRTARYDDEDCQIGIEYYSEEICYDTEECNKRIEKLNEEANHE